VPEGVKAVGDVFFTVLGMSGYGTVAAAAAMLAALLFWRTRCSKTALLLLWLAVGFRLVCPWSPPSPVSLFNLGPFARSASQMADAGEHYAGDARWAVNSPAGQSREDFERAVEAGVEPVRGSGGNFWEVHYYENNAGNITPAKTLREAYGPALFGVWLAGALGFLAYGGASYLRLKRRLRFAVRDEDMPGVWYSDYIPSPCVAGFVRPQVYLTFGMDEGERSCVLAHERQHIRNRDHIWKALGWLVMCVHWFNPLLWLAYGGFLRMIESACDQRVLRELGEERKADYGQALLSLSTPQRLHPGLSPLAFGEGDTKGRVKNVLNYKTPLAWLTGAALVLCGLVGVCVLTGRAEAPSIEEAYGTYKIDGVVHLTMVSSITPDGLLEQKKGTEIVFTAERFHAGNVDVEQPVYEPMELGDILHTTEMGIDDPEFQSMSAIDLTEYGSVQGWKVRNADGSLCTALGDETDLRVFAVDGKLWLGHWVFHDTASVPYGEYWDIFEAGRAESFAPAVEASAPVLPDSPTPVPFGQTVDEAQPSGAAQNAKPSGEVVYDFKDTPFSFITGCQAVNPHTTFTAQVVASDPDMGTLTVRPETPVAGVELLLLEDFWDPSLFKAGDRMLIKARNIVEGDDHISSRQLNDVVPLSSVEAEWRVDLTGDGVEERVFVTSYGKDAGLFYLVVENMARNSGPEIIWFAEAGHFHAGQNGFYLYEDPADGSFYLLNWVSYMAMGEADYRYSLFALSPDGTEQVIRNGSLAFDVNEVWVGDPAEMRRFDREINGLLDHSVVLLSTNFDTPPDVYWGSPEDPVIPIGPFDSGADYFEALQAVAQGTYTFTGEIVGVGEDGIVVCDQTLWAGINEQSYFFFIPASALDVPLDTSLEGRLVTVTADGPLYFHDRPAEDTHVEARLIGATGAPAAS